MLYEVITSNGRQPTVIVVGEVQLLSITKEVLVSGGGMALAGGELEYVIRVTNIGSMPVTNMVVIDDLDPTLGDLGDQVNYVTGSGTLNGYQDDVTFADAILTANYAQLYGNLQPGDITAVRFRVQIDSALAIGTTITNTGESYNFV